MGHAGEETIRGVSDDSTAGVVFVLDRTLKRSYGVQFTGGRLTYADRGWGTKNGDGLDAVIKALGALAEKGATSCSVDHAPLSEPDTTADRVFVRCGLRGVMMVKGRVNGIDTYDVNEFIGEFITRPGGKIE